MNRETQVELARHRSHRLLIDRNEHYFVLRLERHRLGPRVYLCGLRIHEFALGFGLLVVLIVGGFVEFWELTRPTEAAALVGTWLIGKDWRDLFPSRRNTAAWSLLPHRVPRD